MDLPEHSPVRPPPETTLGDRVMGIVTVSLAFVLAVTFIAGGIAFSLFPNAKIGQVGNALAADLFLTLGVTTFVGALSWCLPHAPVFRAIADNMFMKLCILAVVLALVFFVLLIFVI
jgi:hypothetical protein